MGYNLDDHLAHSDLSTRTVQILNDKERPPEDDFSPSSLKRKAEAFKEAERERGSIRLRRLIDEIKKEATASAASGRNDYYTHAAGDLIGQAADHFSHMGFGTSINGTVLTLRW